MIEGECDIIEQFITKGFRTDSLDLIFTCNVIIEEYQAQGFTLTIRQLYYQLVARDQIPNTQKSYKRVGSILNDARLAGLVDWDAIEDRTRNLQALDHWNTPADIVGACADQFRVDKWADQEYAPEVWIEKEALSGVIEPVCNEFDVPYLACRGYMSQSEQWRAAKRCERASNEGRYPIIFHLGDHDPSGIDMTRDNEDRLNLLSNHFGAEVRRLALNMDQVDHYKPPPNPAKMTDSRAANYVDRFGGSSWELDALEPAVIAELISDAIFAIRDHEKWDEAVEREMAGRETLRAVVDQLDD